ncbi:MAG: bifunctional 4-hydroxy-2-oxoglutarate aldolase/2-dehydro-3-deoxy-phosphogluconate aldolase [Bacteroidota bacterium]
MARHSRIDVFQQMESDGVVPLAYHSEVETMQSIVAACNRGGLRTFEFTSRGDFAHEVFRELSKYCRAELPGLKLGVGSVTDAGQASMYMQLGADFIVTPSLREDIAIVCNRRKVMYAPGCGSLTEIGRAEELGCELVKLFPGSVYGPNMIKSIKAPQPWTSVMPTGGVSPTRENLTGWFAAGATCVGMGSKLITKEILRDHNFQLLEQRVQDCLVLVREIRRELG